MGESAIYLAIGSGGNQPATRFGRVTSVEDNDARPPSGSGPDAKPRSKGLSYYYDANDFITRTTTGYSWKRGDRRFEFDEDGRLVECAVANGQNTVAYTYRDGGLVSLRDGSGNVIDDSSDAATGSRRYSFPGRKPRYLYDGEGMLALLRIDGAHRQSCEYDTERRLVQVREGAGAVSCGGVYDDLGLLVLDGAIASSVGGAGVIRRNVKNGRVVAAMDESPQPRGFLVFRWRLASDPDHS